MSSETGTSRLIAIFVGLVNGAIAGGIIAWVLLTFNCYLTSGSDCSDGYIAMILLGPAGAGIGALVGGIAGARSSRAAKATVGLTVGLILGFIAGVVVGTLLFDASSALVAAVVALVGGGAGATTVWRRSG